MEKKLYIQPEIEHITPEYLLQPEGDLPAATPGSGEEYGGANTGAFDDDDAITGDDFFTPVATSLWD